MVHVPCPVFVPLPDPLLSQGYDHFAAFAVMGQMLPSPVQARPCPSQNSLKDLIDSVHD